MLARTVRALRTLSAGNRTLLRANDEAELLHEMCRVIVEDGGYRVASVGYAEYDERKSIRLMASFGIDPVDLECLPLTWADSGFGDWAVATAIRTGNPSVGRHLLTEPSYAPIRNYARKAGYAAATALPLRIEGQVIGALSILAADPDAFDEAEMRLLGELADDLAYGISNLRTRVKHREAERTIERMAYYDPLTGLPNRLSLCEQLSTTLEGAKQHFNPLALLVLKMGQLQEINETLGYREGERFLQTTCTRLQPFADQAKMVARVGEDEFAVLLTDAGSEHATQVAQDLLGILREPVELTEFAVDSRASIGIALFPGHGTDADDLLRRATVAAGQARHTASGHALYRGSPDREFARRLSLMGELRHAIARNELLLYCQPKVDLGSQRVCGAEALVRWQHPKHGMLSTGEFIKIAEHAGLITPLTQWVLEAAFRQSYAWVEAGMDLPMSVNLSAHDLRDPRLLDRIKGLFDTWGTAPELIQFELTESALMEEPVGALEILTRLKDLGVELLIDDFGTGYSSLTYLQKLPVDTLKIDQSFVANMLASDDSEIIVRSTIELGHNLGLKIVAEGVETQAVWERLVALGCDTAQGYLISRPIPAGEFPDWERHSCWHAQDPLRKV
ncbi:EAL domain-containing protein [Aromatoleum toluclasticum]|uniref:putative bifunctional diguanylate cyclase/phosphodiesterase n=1 Tax=Aromatoleum toluclasticum TaxID=92003 RepID=UPI001D17F2F2|nr:EAL domain-containing protein [Aromatoleum toluclasticum]MCC4118664.1 EAL domain-containing protein [Aromatoleum toluclasticum]